MQAFCQVSTDTARYYAELDRQARYEAAIEQIADEIDPADVIEGMDEAERTRLSINLNAMLRGSRISQDQALDEIRVLMRQSAWRQAEAQYKEECDQAARDAAVRRWEQRMEWRA